MGSFGERMQREREMRGITLEEIAESTKIGTRSLRALEGEDFDKLPGGIFNKGFVRAYAKYLGIDEEQAVTDFMAAYGDHQQQLPEPPPQETKLEQDTPPASLNLLVVGGAIVVLALFFAIWGFHDRISGAARAGRPSAADYSGRSSDPRDVESVRSP
jgi:cytoskeletal protein RodZ